MFETSWALSGNVFLDRRFPDAFCLPFFAYLSTSRLLLPCPLKNSIDFVLLLVTLWRVCRTDPEAVVFSESSAVSTPRRFFHGVRRRISFFGNLYPLPPIGLLLHGLLSPNSLKVCDPYCTELFSLFLGLPEIGRQPGEHCVPPKPFVYTLLFSSRPSLRAVPLFTLFFFFPHSFGEPPQDLLILPLLTHHSCTF